MTRSIGQWKYKVSHKIINHTKRIDQHKRSHISVITFNAVNMRKLNTLFLIFWFNIIIERQLLLKCC